MAGGLFRKTSLKSSSYNRYISGLLVRKLHFPSSVVRSGNLTSFNAFYLTIHFLNHFASIYAYCLLEILV